MAGEIASAYVRIRPNMTGFKGETEGGVRSGFGGIGKIVAGAFAGIAVFDFAKSAVEGAAQLQKSTEVVASKFGEASDAVTKFNDTAAAKLGISAAVGESTAAKFGILFDNLGIGKKRAAEMTVGFEQLTGSLSAIRGADPSDVMNKIVLAAAGNTRGLKQLGIVVDTAGIKQEALKQHLISTVKDAITPAIKAQAIYGIATKHLADYQTEAAKHSGDFANQQRVLSAEWANAKDRIGADLLPAMTKLATGLSTILPGAIAVITGAVSGLVSLLKDVFGPVVAPIIDEFGKLKDVFDSAGGGADGLRAVFDKLKTQFDNLSTPAKVAAGAIALIAVALAAAAVAEIAAALPITAIVLGVVALAEGFKYAYDNSATFRRIIQDIADFVEARVLPSVKRLATEIGQGFANAVAFVKSIWPQVEQVFQMVLAAVEALWNRFGSTIIEIVKTEFEAVKKLVGDAIRIVEDIIKIALDLITGKWGAAWGALKDLVRTAFNAVVTVITTYAKVLALEAEAVGKAVLDGIVKGLSALASLVGTELGKLAGVIDTAAGNVVGWAAKIGRDMVGGIINGFSSVSGGLKSWIESKIHSILNALNPFSPVSHGGEVYIGRPIAEGAISGFLLGITPLQGTISQKLRDALTAARTVVQAEQGKLATQFSALGSYATRAFEAATTAELAKMSSAFDAKIKRLVTDPMAAELAAFAAANDRVLAGLDREQGAQTPAEKTLADLQAAHDKAGRDMALADAKATLAADTAADAAASQILGDKRAVADAEYAITVSSLQEQAAAQRTALNARVDAERAAQATLYANQQKAIQEGFAANQAALQAEYDTQVLDYQSQRDLQEQHLQKMLTTLGTELGKHPSLWQATHDKIMALFANAFGPDYVTAGRNLGTGFAKGLRESFAAVHAATVELAGIVAKNMKLGSPAKEGPLASLDSWWTPFAATLLRGLDAGAIRDALTSAVNVGGLGATVAVAGAPNVGGSLSQLALAQLAVGRDADTRAGQVLDELKKQTGLLEGLPSQIPGGAAASGAGTSLNQVAQAAQR